MSKLHVLGFPRVGAKRELKFAQERYWRKELELNDLLEVAKRLRQINWAHQAKNEVDLIAVGDFSFYDQILDLQVATGTIPERFGFDSQNLDLAQYFQLARGNADQPAIEMTKWFDTNYHYLVPEFTPAQQPKANSSHYVAQVKEAVELGYEVKATLIGPLTYLYLGKEKAQFDRIELLEKLVVVYQQLIQDIAKAGAKWIEIDEPALALDLPQAWLDKYSSTYQALAGTAHENNAKLLFATYFGSVAEHADLIKSLPVDGLHLDLVRAPEQISAFLDYDKVLSAGVINGRNIWRSNLNERLEFLAPLKAKLGDRLWIAPSCSLLHSPYDLDVEVNLDNDLKSWLSFTLQKLVELRVLKTALNGAKDKVQADIQTSQAAADARVNSKVIHRAEVAQRLASLPVDADKRASDFATRIKLQQDWLNLPLLPTTTIGSFPQTAEIRKSRADFKKGAISEQQYNDAMRAEIAHVVKVQEDLDIDVLVHGEAERNDMVEYFGELLDGFAFTKFGWVQSYGSRCVKPPIIFGDVVRSKPMTVEWSSYAQSLTKRPMKGMLTGPVTILQWSFVRDDTTRENVTKQIALALSDEVLDLERAGIRVIQIDEPAIREGLPLKRKDWDEYLAWAGFSFRLSHSGCADSTQIHTHMCYSEFNDILPAISALDADVITIETSRSDMQLLSAFSNFKYPNDIGPGIYDIHSPRVPDDSEYEHLLRKALEVVPAQRLWINPDCGLKTRAWPETIGALEKMVKVAKKFRQELNQAR